jgi:EmrB/QacA subfamily drug resistance transporter
LSTDPPSQRPVAALGPILATVALTTMLAPLNSTMIGVALPMVTAEFAVDLSQSSWLVIAYLIVMASLQPVAGKLGDRWGHRRMILGGLGYFALASVGAALATDLSGLLFFRVQQAVAGAIALPNGMAIMRRIVPAEERGRRFGLVGAAVVLAAAAGPPLGGALIEWVGWRAVFYVNLVLILPTFLLGWRVLPVLEKRSDGHGFDWSGALVLLALLAGGAGLLTRRGGTNTEVLVGGVLALAVVGLFFLYREWRHPDPILQPRFFLRRTFAAANASILLSNLAMYTTFLAIPLFLVDAPGWGSAKAGAVLAVMWAPTAFCAPVGGRLADRFGRRWPTAAGLALFALGLWAVSMAVTGTRIELAFLAGGLALAGVGLGLSQAGLQTAAVEAVSDREAGSAAGIFSTSRYIGSITGSSLLPLLFGTGSGADGFARVLLMVLVAAVAAVAVSLAIEDRPV